MSIIKIAAFADGEEGGNPAGVYLSGQHPSDDDMQRIAAEVGFSETAFARPSEDGWRVRYFSPESEVPFCGHATIALGAALAHQHEPGVFTLALNNTSITVEGFHHNETMYAALQSPLTTSRAAPAEILERALDLFGYQKNHLDTDIPPAMVNGGADHLVIGLKTRESLAAMQYDLDAGRQFMNDEGLVTVMFVYSESQTRFHSRNPFASGGVYEDAATGAATAAFAGYLRDIAWDHQGEISIVQGEDMGSRSLLKAQISDVPGASIRVSGAVRWLS